MQEMAERDASGNAREKAIRRAGGRLLGGRPACSHESAAGRCDHAGADRRIDILLGGFGPLNGQNAKGVELQTLVRADNGTSGAKLVVSRRELLADLPSPTWFERDGDMLYAVLENTGEVASLRIVRNDGGGRGAGCRCNDEHRDNGRVCGGRDGAKDCADNLNRDGHDGDDGDARGRNVRLEQTSRITVQGDGPTHAALAIDDEGHRHLIVACYGDGSIGVHRLDEQGRILPGNQLLEGEGHGPLPAQAGPHAHWILPLPDGRVLTTDLGADRVYVHRWEHGTLRRSAAVRLAPGTGPRDMHLMPTNGGGWRVAVVDEWGCTVTVLAGVFEQDFGQDTVPQPQAGDADAGDHAFADGGVRVVQTISLGGDAIDQAASLAYVPSGRLGDAVHCGETARAEGHVTDGCGIAYVGLRGSDRIVALLWDGERFARLTDPGVNDGRGRGTPCGGSRPRQLVAFGTLLLAADEASNNLAVFDIEDAGEPCLVARFDADSPTVILRV